MEWGFRLIPIRWLCIAVTMLALEACSVGPLSPLASAGVGGYGERTDGGFAIAAVPLDRIPSRFRRQDVAYHSAYAPGTVVVDPGERFLYLVESNGRATRFGVSVGQGAFGWSGEARIERKSRWPRWAPTPEMLRRAPDLAGSTAGREPGSLNPMGARALYLFQGGKDTLFRLHGTPEWWSIGKAASNGCIRLLNQDIVDLYDRVALGAKVIVLKSPPLFIADR